MIDRALKYGIARNAKIEGAAKIVPWYQDFTLGKPKYGVEQIREQIRAGHDNGIESWVLWNASSRYTEAALGTRAPREAGEPDHPVLPPGRVPRSSWTG